MITIDTPKKKIPKLPWRSKGWVAIGFDLSPSGIAGAAAGYDQVFDRHRAPVFTEVRWPKHTHYFTRIEQCARSHGIVLDLLAGLSMSIEPDDVYIAIEEPFPLGMIRRLESSALKQQAEISGAFMGGLLRYGYMNIFQIGNHQWRQIIANDLGITIGYQKWNYQQNPFSYAPSGKGSGKWRSKEWALENGFPAWPDLIHSQKHGKIPRPRTSRAMGVQPDDRYDALAIMTWMQRELVRTEVKNEGL